MCVCVCVCVWLRERERAREGGGGDRLNWLGAIHGVSEFLEVGRSDVFDVGQHVLEVVHFGKSHLYTAQRQRHTHTHARTHARTHAHTHTHTHTFTNERLCQETYNNIINYSLTVPSIDNFVDCFLESFISRCYCLCVACSALNAVRMAEMQHAVHSLPPIRSSLHWAALTSALTPLCYFTPWHLHTLQWESLWRGHTNRHLVLTVAVSHPSLSLRHWHNTAISLS